MSLDPFRRLMARWLGVRYVRLWISDLGTIQVVIRRAWRIGSPPHERWASRYFGDLVILDPDGTTRGGMYAERWEPHLDPPIPRGPDPNPL